jgi:hypothetical protein
LTERAAAAVSAIVGGDTLVQALNKVTDAIIITILALVLFIDLFNFMTDSLFLSLF